MGMDAFGVVAVLISILSFFDMISNAGLPAATFRLYNDDSDPANRSSTLGSSLLLFILLASALGIAVWQFADVIAAQFLGDVTFAPTVRVVAVLLLVITLVHFAEIILRIQVRPKAKVSLDLFLICTQVALALILVIVFSLGAFGYWLGQLGGAALALLLAIWLIKGTTTFTFSKQRAKELLSYGLPLMPSAIGLWGLRLADRWIITASLGLSEVAIYEVGYKVGMITALLIPPFLVAWPQFAFSRMHKANAARTYRDVLTALAAAIVFLALFVISFRHELVAMMAPAEYAGAAAIVPWIALSQVAWALYPVLSLGPKITKNTMVLSGVALISCLVNLGLNFLLIPRVGIVGSAFATFVGYWILAITAYVAGSKKFAFPIDWRRLLRITAAAGVTLFITTQVAEMLVVPWQRTTLQIAGILAYPIVLLLIGFVTWANLRDGVQYGWLRARTVLDRS
jgi:O-antigen/teichoic acid export membrane protein